MSTFLFENIFTLSLKDTRELNELEFYNFTYSKTTNHLILISDAGFSFFNVDFNRKMKTVDIVSGIQ